jgi:hypothetical protein
VTETSPVIVLDLDDTIINFRGMSEESWRVICRESADEVGVDGDALHAALMVERVAFWADPGSNQFGRQNLVRASEMVVERAMSRLGAGSREQAAALARLYSDRRWELMHVFPDSIAALADLL